MATRYFNSQTSATEFANDILQRGGRARLSVTSVFSPVLVTFSVPVKAHLRKGRPVRGSVRRVRRSR